ALADARVRTVIASWAATTGAGAGANSRETRPQNTSPTTLAPAAAQEEGRDAPIGLRGRKQLSVRQHIGGDDAGKAQAEGGGNSEKANFILREHERRHRDHLTRRARQHPL